MSKPPRAPWSPGFPAFPDVALHAEETSVRRSVGYLEAKSGDADAAIELVMRFLSPVAIELVNGFAQQREPIIVSVHAVEQQSVNAIPEAMANELGRRLDWPVEHDIVQVNVVGHTRADGYHRLANQAAFSGAVTAGSDYLLVDDFVGQGGTLANLRGFIVAQGGRVVGATTLTGKPVSTILALKPDQLTSLRSKHGKELEDWWQDRFGHAFDCLTESEARYLERRDNAFFIRDRIIAAKQA